MLNFSKQLILSLACIAELYEAPSESLRMKALTAIDNAIENLSTDNSIALAIHESGAGLQRQVLASLHFIHSALLDEESVLIAKEKI